MFLPAGGQHSSDDASTPTETHPQSPSQKSLNTSTRELKMSYAGDAVSYKLCLKEYYKQLSCELKLLPLRATNFELCESNCITFVFHAIESFLANA